MRALVTGAAGFIGSHLVDALLARGNDVIGVDDLSTGRLANLGDAFGCGSRFTFVEADVRRLGTALFGGVETVYHLAAAKKAVSLEDPWRDLDVNAGGTLAVLLQAARTRVRKVVHVSTGSVYGEALYRPQDEQHPLNPVSLYGVSKLAGERYALAFRRLHGLNVTVLRYFHVYGPRQDGSIYGGVVPIFIRQMLARRPLTVHGDGAQERSFTYVDDVVRSTLFAAQLRLDGQVFNVASGLRVTINDLVRSLSAIAGHPLEVEHLEPLPGDIRVFHVGHRRLAECGLEGEWVDLDAGLRRTVEWYRGHAA